MTALECFLSSCFVAECSLSVTWRERCTKLEPFNKHYKEGKFWFSVRKDDVFNSKGA